MAWGCPRRSMTALELLTAINQVLFVGLFLAVVARAARQPTRANLNAALLFGGIAAVVVVSRVSQSMAFAPPWLPSVLVTILNLCPLAMLRLVDDFRGSPRWVQIGGAATFIVLAVLSLAFFGTMPQLVSVVTIVWFLVVGGYAAVAFTRASRRSRGLTRWRMAAVAAGAYLFVAAIVVVFLAAVLPAIGASATPFTQLLALAAVIAFFLGFAPPAWLRRAWREPDLRSFLERSVHLSGVVHERELVSELQRAAADTLGAPGAAVGLADTSGRRMRYLQVDGTFAEYPANRFIGGRAFVAQQRLIVRDTVAADPEQAAAYTSVRANVAIAVPITADQRRLGVLVVYGDRAPIFVEDDLWLVQLLAEQTAVILEARRMAREASELRRREETTLLKEEFLSAAAHDLRTPLTVLLGQAELIERRQQRDPGAAVDPAGIVRIVRESRRLRDLVTDLLEAQRVEDVGPGEDQQPADLRELIRASLERFPHLGSRIESELPDEPIMVRADRMRLEQVLDNLLENAAKYAATGPPILVRAWIADSEARMAVIRNPGNASASVRSAATPRSYTRRACPPSPASTSPPRARTLGVASTASPSRCP